VVAEAADRFLDLGADPFVEALVALDGVVGVDINFHKLLRMWKHLH
jgi:hypothetical protein